MRSVASVTRNMTLDGVIRRLRAQASVDGIVLLGSTGEDSLTEASDYDLLLVLSAIPVPLHAAITRIDHRLTDVIFTTTELVDRIAAPADLSEVRDDEAGRLARSLRDGVIAFDRHDRLRDAQRRLKAAALRAVRTYGELYARWFRANYSVEQTRRYLSSADPLYRLALDLRMLYQLTDLEVDYFACRQLPWRGWKEAIRYWAEHDPTYLDLLKRCLTEPDRPRKVALCERLAALAMEPVGGLWEPGSTAVLPRPKPDLRPEGIESALAFWESLVRDDGAPGQ